MCLAYCSVPPPFVSCELRAPRGALWYSSSSGATTSRQTQNFSATKPVEIYTQQYLLPQKAPDLVVCCTRSKYEADLLANSLPPSAAADSLVPGFTWRIHTLHSRRFSEVECVSWVVKSIGLDSSSRGDATSSHVWIGAMIQRHPE